jgi:hypothetical protein
MRKDKKQESLGFIFGYKESGSYKNENNQNVFTVSFKSGTSKKFPSKFQKFKDFWAEEIFPGQVSELYVNLEYFKEAFNQELKEITDDLNSEHSYYKESYNKQKYYFDYDIKHEQLAALSAFSMAHLHTAHQKWENDKVFEEALKACIGDLFKDNKRSIAEVYENYKEVSTYIYNRDVAEALGNLESEPTKPKMK